MTDTSNEITGLIDEAEQRGHPNCVCGSTDHSDGSSQCLHHRERALDDIRKLVKALKDYNAERIEYRDLWVQRSDDADAARKELATNKERTRELVVAVEGYLGCRAVNAVCPTGSCEPSIRVALAAVKGQP